ncbi:hypothetical protein ASD04_18525 [Devosia sp. Root436]|nr:hypothetical protein ASD04_18525 [Devosia sp. Root436]
MDFDETAYPELLAIFAEIDSAIAAMVVSDPGFQARGSNARRSRQAVSAAKIGQRKRRAAPRAAA